MATILEDKTAQQENKEDTIVVQNEEDTIVVQNVVENITNGPAQSVKEEEEEKTYSEDEVIDMCIKEEGMTILRTSEGKIYRYNRDTEEHAESAFLKNTTKSDLANIEYLQIKNSCCIECSEKLIEAYKDLQKRPKLYFSKLYQDKAKNDFERSKQAIDDLIRENFEVKFWEKFYEELKKRGKDIYRAERLKTYLEEETLENNTSKKPKLDFIATVTTDEVNDITDPCTTETRADQSQNKETESNDMEVECPLSDGVDEDEDDSVALEAYKTEGTFLYTDTGEKYISTDEEHAEIMFINDFNNDNVYCEEIWIKNSPCSRCSQQLLNFFYGYPKPTIYVGQIWRLRSEKDKEGLIKLMKYGFEIEVWDELHDKMHKNSSTTYEYIEKLKSRIN